MHLNYLKFSEGVWLFKIKSGLHCIFVSVEYSNAEQMKYDRWKAATEREKVLHKE